MIVMDGLIVVRVWGLVGVLVWGVGLGLVVGFGGVVFFWIGLLGDLDFFYM